MKKILLLVLTAVLFSFFSLAFIESKEAVLLFGGIFGSTYKMNRIKEYLIKEYGYDVYWIDFLIRESWEKSMNNAESALSKIQFDQYEKVHIFCHIFGGRIVLEYFQKNKIKNLSSILFDRGPLEEELGFAVRNRSGENALIFFGGQSLLTFINKESFKIPENLSGVKIGIIIETKGIAWCYIYKKEIKKGNPSFNPAKIFERYDDYYYIPLQHRQMYVKIEKFGPELNYFFKTGKFSDKVNRVQRNYLDEF
jgi:hypothetical protein